jgi:hypothetical protein
MIKRLDLLLVAALIATSGCARIGIGETRRADLKERDELRQSYQLSPGARVEVAGINGLVNVETTNTDTAEVSVVRYAATRAALERHKVVIDHAPTSLIVHGENNNSSVHSMLAHLFTNSDDVRQEVTLKVPHHIALFTNGVNGRVTIGDVDGAVSVRGVNGRVEIAQARDHAEVNGVNGGVTMTLAQLGEQGVRMSGINGGIELRFANDVNASFSVQGINGGVRSDAPDIIVEKQDRSNATAQIGKGGAPVSLSGINGGVKLTRAGESHSSSSNDGARPANVNQQTVKGDSTVDDDSEDEK